MTLAPSAPSAPGPAPRATSRARRAAIALTAALLASLTLAACAPAERYVEPPVGESGVVMWPDYGDFLVEGNKAIKTVTSMTLEGRQADADTLMRIAGTAQARWVGDWMVNTRVSDIARNLYSAADETDRIPLIALSGDPGAECGIVDAAAAAAEYRALVEAVVETLPDYEVDAWFILEPGAISSLGNCDGQGDRIAMLNDAITILADAGATVYVDAGSSRGIDAATAADRLAQLDLDRVAGIAIGTGSYDPLDVEVPRGDEILALLKDAGFDDLGYVVDTSRNGAGTVVDETCNPEGQAIGKAPRLVGEGNLDAYVWVKRPGESDGTCRVGIEEGQFAPSLAVELASNAEPENA